MCKREFIFCRSQIRKNGSRPPHRSMTRNLEQMFVCGFVDIIPTLGHCPPRWCTMRGRTPDTSSIFTTGQSRLNMYVHYRSQAHLSGPVICTAVSSVADPEICWICIKVIRIRSTGTEGTFCILHFFSLSLDWRASCWGWVTSRRISLWPPSTRATMSPGQTLGIIPLTDRNWGCGFWCGSGLVFFYYEQLFLPAVLFFTRLHSPL